MKKNPNRDRKVRTPDGDGRFSININGKKLSGVKAGGRWVFACDPWHEVATKHHDATSARACVTEFMLLAIPFAVVIERG